GGQAGAGGRLRGARRAGDEARAHARHPCGLLHRGAGGVRDHLRHRAHAPSAGLAVSVAGVMPAPEPACTGDGRDWIAGAIAALGRETARSADTHLLHATFPGLPGIDFYFKDEAAHPTGSLKHRLARSLFLFALCNGRLHVGQAVGDAHSGSTAISEAWFARLLGLSFTAVMRATTAPAKIEAVQALGGRCDLTGPDTCPQARATEIAARGACFLDQFGLAERATDWRGNNNIAESIIGQLREERFPEPAWIVCGAGTGGTSATIGRYLRYIGLPTRLCVAEPEGMAFAHAWRDRDRDAH